MVCQRTVFGETFYKKGTDLGGIWMLLQGIEITLCGGRFGVIYVVKEHKGIGLILDSNGL